jgi:hypothetical protein
MSFIEYNLRELPGERKISFLQAVISYTSDHDNDDDLPELLEILSDDHDDDDDLPELLVDYATLLNDVCNLVGFFLIEIK